MRQDHDDSTGQFLPGNRASVTAIEKRRDKSVSEYIKDKTKNGQEIINKLLIILRSKKTDVKDRVIVAKELLDRGWGKPSQHRTLDKRTIEVKVQLPADLVDDELPRKVTKGKITIVK